MGEAATAVRPRPLDDAARVRDGGGAQPPVASQRLGRLLWKLYDAWERDQRECETSKASE